MDVILAAAVSGLLVFITGLLTLCGALGGVVVGGLLEGYRQRKQFERLKRWERSQLRNQKLEAIATAANEVTANLERVFALLAKSKSHKSLPKPSPEALRIAMQKLELLEKELLSSRAPYLRMLVAFYAPELLDHMASIWSAHSDLHQSITKLVGAEAPDERRRALKEYQVHMSTAESACLDLAEAAASLVRKELGLDVDAE